MRRQLPIVDIAGTSFYVDVLHDELRQQEDPSNTIPFGVFDQDGNGYTFLYDSRIKNIPRNKGELKQLEDGMLWVTIPALMELDPEGIALKYDIPLSILCPDLESVNRKHYYDEQEEDDGMAGFDEESF